MQGYSHLQSLKQCEFCLSGHCERRALPKDCKRGGTVLGRKGDGSEFVAWTMVRISELHAHQSRNEPLAMVRDSELQAHRRRSSEE